MKKLIIVVLLVVFLLVVTGPDLYENLVGMVSTTVQSSLIYTCTDNDFSAGNPINARGTVIVASSDGEKEIYTDGCLDQDTLREYSCDPDTRRQLYTDYSCSDFNQTCRFGRCA